MTGHAWYLLVVLVAAIAILVALINSRLRLHPFVALLVTAVATGLLAGESSAKLVDALEEGAGGILGDVGVTLALGTMLGRLLADSGATDRIARVIVARASARALPLAMAAAAFVIGVPMFFEVGLIVLLPLVFGVARRVRTERPEIGSPYTLLVVPTIAALSTLHGLVPPHPGPLVAVSGLHADLGKTIALGLLCAVPTVVLAGPVFARFLADRVPVQADDSLVEQFVGARREPATASMAGAGVPARSGGPGATGGHGDGHGRGAGVDGAGTEVPVATALFCVAVPVLLMLVRTVAEIVLPDGSPVTQTATLLGDPAIAMLVGFLVAYALLGIGRGRGGEEVRRSVSDSLKPVVGILLIIGGGGAFNGVLKSSGIGGAIATAAEHAHVDVLVLGWLLALLLSATTGSATVGIVSSTGIVAPLVHDPGSWHTSLLVIAIGAGSIGLNWVNHAGFWLVKESFGMTLGQATKIHTTTQTLVSVIALAMVLLLSIWV
jgi:GntP family gluconate:H+ symporter